MRDIRDEILRNSMNKTITACIFSDEAGIVSGIEAARGEAESLGLNIEICVAEGQPVEANEVIMRFSGNPKQIVMAEETLIGMLAKPSGIATSAAKFVKAAEGKFRVVSGAWKKMPPAMKHMVRSAVAAGGASFRISQDPIVYLDKNYVEIFGGIGECLNNTSEIEGFKKVIQLKGKYGGGDIVREAWEAIEAKADILFIDTGSIDDLRKVVDSVRPVIKAMNERGKSLNPEIAYGGGIRLQDVAILKEIDIDVLDIGRQIVDAPLLDMRLDVVGVRGN